MSKRSPQLLLEDIIESANKILAYTNELSYEQFLADSKTVDASIAVPYSTTTCGIRNTQIAASRGIK